MADENAATKDEKTDGEPVVREEVFQVVVRFRPLNEREKKELLLYTNPFAMGDDGFEDMDGESKNEYLNAAVDSLLQMYSSKTFAFDGKAYSFDKVFGCSVNQAELYAQVAQPLVERFVSQPHDVTFIAYGQTSSGKTWTIDGDFYGTSVEDRSQPITNDAGILPRSIVDIFRLANNAFKIELSFYEIYCEKIIDLLGTEDLTIQLFDDRKTGKVFMKNLHWQPIADAEELLRLLFQSRAKRHYSFTQMNANSSRSHTIFDLRLSAKTPKWSIASTDTVYKNFRIVDLAGSERASRTKATGTTFEEGKKINQSLMDLRSVISQLSRSTDSQQRNVNHRASKLTRILYPSFRGKCRVVVLTCCSPSLDSRSETNGSLQFACYAKRITLKLDDIKEATNAASNSLARSEEESQELERRLKRMVDEANERELKISEYEREMNELRDIVRTLRSCKSQVRDSAVSPLFPSTPESPDKIGAYYDKFRLLDEPLEKSGGDKALEKNGDKALSNIGTQTESLTRAPEIVDASAIVQKYTLLLDKEKERNERYRSTIQMQRKLLAEKISDNEMMDQELQMMRMVKNVILQEF